MILDLMKEHPLTFSLPLSPVQGSLYTFLSLSTSDSLFFISLILFSARLKAFMATLRLPSSSFIWRWQKFVISYARNVA